MPEPTFDFEFHGGTFRCVCGAEGGFDQYEPEVTCWACGQVYGIAPPGWYVKD